MSCVKVIAAAALETGAFHVFGAIATRRGCGSVKAPLARWPGSETVSVASPAVEITVAFVDAV